MGDFTDMGAEVVDEFANGPSGETVTRRRYGPTTTINRHRATPAPEETPDLRVFLPPVVSSTDRRREGTRKSGELTFYATSSWRGDDEATQQRGDDLVRADGSVYHVGQVEDFMDSAGFVIGHAMLARRAS